MVSFTELFNLKGRVTVITGGAGHLGYAIGETLAENGANIVLVDINEKELRVKEKRIQEKYSVETTSILLDLQNEKEIRDLPSKVENIFGKLNILVNSAALVGTSNLPGWISPFSEQSAETWRKALEVNLTAPFIMCQSCYPALKKSGNGSIINISSIYGIVGPDMRLYEKDNLGNPIAYAASKGGLNSLTRWLATVLAPEVRVNSITMGGVSRGQPAYFTKEYIKRTPLQRMAVEDDIKGAAAYLASDASNYVTGHNLIVDGGWTIW